MDPFATSHFSNDGLRHDLKTGIASDCMSLAVRLTRIAEFDDRKLYLQDGYPSIYAYCIRELHFSVGAAYKRINAARIARRFPAVLMAVADGRLHLSAVVTLATHLTSGNVDELLAAATHKTRAEIEQLLARRFPRPDLPERLQAIPSPSPIETMATSQEDQLSPGTVDALTIPVGQPTLASPLPLPPGTVDASTISPGQPALEPVQQLSHGKVQAPAPRARMMPLAPQRYGLQATVDQETHDLLQEAQALMSHQIQAGEIAQVLKSALKLLVPHLRKQKFAATTCPHPAARGSAKANGGDGANATRHIPAAVKRAVWERDGGQCTFVSDAGHRCEARTLLELDHIEPVARGGKATTENIRLRCRGHNQYTAECAFGAGFMSDKRAEAQARAKTRNQAKARAAASGQPDGRTTGGTGRPA
jgi:hypothetical protein